MDDKCKKCVKGSVQLCSPCKPATPEMVAETMELFHQLMREMSNFSKEIKKERHPGIF